MRRAAADGRFLQKAWCNQGRRGIQSIKVVNDLYHDSNVEPSIEFHNQTFQVL